MSFDDIPERDFSLYETYVVASWSGNLYSNDRGTWSVTCGPYLDKDNAIKAARIYNENFNADEYQVMTLSEFIDECNSPY